MKTTTRRGLQVLGLLLPVVVMGGVVFVRGRERAAVARTRAALDACDYGRVQQLVASNETSMSRVVDSTKDTLLLAALHHRDIKMVQLLVSRGADVNEEGSGFCSSLVLTPLELAVQNVDIKAVQFLLARGAWVHDRLVSQARLCKANISGDGCYDLASRRRRKFIAPLLEAALREQQRRKYLPRPRP